MRLLAVITAVSISLTPVFAFTQNLEKPSGETKHADACQQILIPGEDWQLVSEGFELLVGPATNARGELFFNDIQTSKTYRLNAEGQPETFVEESGKGNGQAFGPDGRLYAAAAGQNKIVAYNADGSMEVLLDGISGNDLIVRHDGTLYVTEPKMDGKEPGEVWLVRKDGSAQVVDTGLEFPSGIALSPDQRRLYVADSRTRWVYCYQIQTDGALANKRRFFELEISKNTEASYLGGLKVDTDGRLYAVTRAGIEVCDSGGTFQCILPLPNGNLSNLAFGGPGRNLLYATCGDKLYKRKIRALGVESYLAPSQDRKAGGG
jgi:sugar lactone lactonase YvrE